MSGFINTQNVMAMIMAGGQGSRLQPLTKDRAKPAVHFAGIYRIIDFVLNNFINSGIYKIKILTQFKSDSLNQHVSGVWQMNRALNQYVDLVPAQMRTTGDWYKGTADAIYQNLNLITDERPDYVAIFGGDHIYKMDISQMLKLHQEKSALCTIAAIPVPVERANQFGVIQVDLEGRMIGFEEKPEKPAEMPDRPGWCLASMGNYIFSSKFLVRELMEDAKKENSSHDFGKDVIPAMYQNYPVFVYDFNTNFIKGETTHNRGYWKDVGTLDALYEASMDICSILPEFNLYNPFWKIRTYPWNFPPAKFVFAEGETGRKGEAMDSVISSGCIISGGMVSNSVLSPNVRVNSFAEVSHSILFPDVQVGRGAKIRNAIIEKGINIPENAKIGYDEKLDRERFFVTDSGIVIVPKDTIISAEDS